jgi:hypothetical protein
MMKRTMTKAVMGGMALLSLAACDIGTAPDKKATEKLPPQSSTIVAPGGAQALPGTPMADRVAVIGLLNKRNGQTRDLVMKPGKALRVGDAVVRLRACEQTAPWENTPETGAFVQLDVRSPGDGKWRRVFSGWLFKQRPERNVVEHPIYDVWVRECRMTWPEAGPDTLKIGGKTDASAGKPIRPGNATTNATEAAAPEAAGNAAD